MLTAALIVMVALGYSESLWLWRQAKRRGQFVDRSVPAIEQVLERTRRTGRRSHSKCFHCPHGYLRGSDCAAMALRSGGRPIPIRPWLGALILYRGLRSCVAPLGEHSAFGWPISSRIWCSCPIQVRGAAPSGRRERRITNATAGMTPCRFRLDETPCTIAASLLQKLLCLVSRGPSHANGTGEALARSTGIVPKTA